VLESTAGAIIDCGADGGLRSATTLSKFLHLGMTLEPVI
jgi:hypothetical protein